MFINKLFIYLMYAYLSFLIKRFFNMKSSTYYFHMKTKILADFEICISVPLSCYLRYVWHMKCHVLNRK